jgi:hypothetical protein
VERVIERAVTAPVESAVPTAVAHLPTARSVEAADWRSVKAVEEVRVTATLVTFLVVGLVSLTVTVDPFTAVTGPEAAPNCPENLPAPPAPAGRPPPGNPPLPGGRPVPPPKPRPPNPPVQLPEVGWDTLTVVAVTGRPKVDVDDEEDVVGLPNAETHEPTVTLDAVVATVWSKVVVGV